MICSPCVPSLAATKKALSFNDQPEIIYVYVSYMEYGRTHKHSLRRARQTHEQIRRNEALLAYSSKPHKRSSAGQVWLDQAVSCLKKGPSHMHEYPFKQMDPNETETAVGKNFNLNSPYAANSIYYLGLETPITGCPAPRKIIADTGAAVDLIGARDLQNKDKQRKTSEPIHFCTANGSTKAHTIVQYFSSALGQEVSPHVLTDSVSALSIGKRVANGCDFHWTPKNINGSGSCTLIKPDGKRIEFEVDGHDVPYLMEHRTTAVPAQIQKDKENQQPTAVLVEETRARSDQKLRSI